MMRKSPVSLILTKSPRKKSYTMTKPVDILLSSLLAILVRWCVSLNKYSGAGKAPMFGDYEAQRHWMEVTYNLPVSEWYKNTTNNDLMYWGLDYPPLTAYHSWLIGAIAMKINPQWVALNSSRGYESYTHKVFMRYTVMIADVGLYFPAVFLFFMVTREALSFSNKLKASLLMLLYPGLILIDHGHFQYNCISLGLTLFAVLFLSKNYDLLGSISFCLALNYKQMELYHALPFFCYLLGRCIHTIRDNGLFHLIKIGVTVIITFTTCWFPFVTDKTLVLQVLHRIFPVARGLYEDKVANVWCSLSVVIKLKQLFTVDQLLLLCVVCTLVLLLPTSCHLLLRPSFERFKLSLINSSLVFFLFSFHVHEKTILVPALAVCLQILDNPLLFVWFSVISTFSMLPLLIKDGLVVAYIGTTVFYTILCFCILPNIFQSSGKNRWRELTKQALFCLSLLGVVCLSIASLTLKPPQHLPDLFPVLISMYSCGHFVCFLIYFHVKQFTFRKDLSVISHVSLKKKMS